MQHYLEVEKLSKQFGSFIALDKVSFGIPRGEFVCFLGPSGCGKTTLLRCIAGLEVQSEGTLRQDRRDISRLPPSQRDFGIVFQSYALFPNLTVAENIGFAIVSQRRLRSEIDARVAELIELVGLVGHENKYPGQLSGGQQQRVALARSLAPSPGLLLLDEPLSALDAKVRARLRREIKEVQMRLGVTTIMVTHDQEEAQTMADRILVMCDGRIVQNGTPSEIYDEPATAFVADFIGQMNFFDGTVDPGGLVDCENLALMTEQATLPPKTRVTVAFRPEDVGIGRAPEANSLEATITAVEDLGPFVRLYLRSHITAKEFRADLRKATDGRRLPKMGEHVVAHVPAARIRLYRQDA